ncbi:MAG TPA: hypothetical protein VFW65_35565 [Pseudonocardiaceae bacterium]|nr:hypothetical protein [Pseudonocardiaceae bacterium]
MNARKKAQRFLDQLREQTYAMRGTASDGLPAAVAQEVLDQYLRETGHAHDPAFRAALDDVVARAVEGGIDAMYDTVLPEMQDVIEKAADDMQDTVGGSVKSRGWTGGQRPLIGHLSTGQLNAVSMRVPGRDKTYLVLIEDQLPAFARQISQVVAWAMPRDSSTGATSFKIDRDNPTRQINAVPEIAAWFADIVVTYAATGQASLREHSLPPGHRELARILDLSLMYFVLGHEYAHVMLGHLDTTPVRKGVLPVTDVEVLKYSWRQESQADLFGTILSINARTAAHQVDFGTSFLGVSLFFDALEVMDRAVALLQTGNEHARQLGSHPLPGLRKQALRKDLSMLADADPARMAAPVRRALLLDETQSEIIRLLWERTRPLLLDLHRTGVPPAASWRTVPTPDADPPAPAPVRSVVREPAAASTSPQVPPPAAPPAAPTETSFLVTDVWDLPSRDGLLTSGKTLTGKIRTGMTLRDDAGHQTSVLALEFLSPRDIANGEVTVMLERTDPSPVRLNAVLTATTSPG